MKSEAQKRVEKEFPDTTAQAFGAKKGPWGVIGHVGPMKEILGRGDTEDLAWADADAQLEIWVQQRDRVQEWLRGQKRA